MTSDKDPRSAGPTSVSWEESLLDDGIDDTFPASDPVSHGQPGSILNLRYAALEPGPRAAPRSGGIAGTLLLIGVACACVFVIARRRKASTHRPPRL